MMMRIRIGGAFAFIGGVFLGLLAFSTENHRRLFAFGAVVQISWAFVLILRPGWVYKDL